MDKLISKKELFVILGSALISAFSIGFNDKRPKFILELWFTSFILILILSVIATFIFVYIAKKYARRINVSTEITTWSIGRFAVAPSEYLKKPIYIGIGLPIIITIFSNGLVPFASALQNNLSYKLSHRLGKEYHRLTEFETAKLSAIPSLVLTIIALFSIVLLPDDLAVKTALVFLVIAGTNMLPLPNLNGLVTFFGSPLLAMFSWTFMIVSAVLIWFIHPFLTFGLAVFLSIVVFLLYYYHMFVKK